MVTTGDHDDRVVRHTALSLLPSCRKTSGTNPTLGRIDINAGHGAGKSVAATIQENVDIQAFTLAQHGDYDHPCK
jgi:prolyl oligopeptidase